MNTREEIIGRVALIPGAGRPVGRAIADLFGARGASLVLPTIEDWPGANERVKDAFTAAGYDFLMLPCDLRDREQTTDLLEKVDHRYGALHYLINNIERGGMPVVHGAYELEVNRDQWQLEIDTTLKAKYNLCRSAAQLLKNSGSGAIINISSMAALVGRAGPAALLFSDGYSAANMAISSLTRQWAREMAPSVRVNEIMLGLIAGRHGAGTRAWKEIDEQEQQELIDHTLAGRIGTPQEVAEFVYFLAVKALYMSGAVIPFDGGYLCGTETVAPMPPGILE